MSRRKISQSSRRLAWRRSTSPGPEGSSAENRITIACRAARLFSSTTTCRTARITCTASGAISITTSAPTCSASTTRRRTRSREERMSRRDIPTDATLRDLLACDRHSTADQLHRGALVHYRAHFDERIVLQQRPLRRDLHCFVETLRLHQDVAADCFLRLGEGSVRHRARLYTRNRLALVSQRLA